MLKYLKVKIEKRRKKQIIELNRIKKKE